MTLTPIERILRRILIDQARVGRTIHYAELVAQLAPYSPTRLSKPWSPMFSWLAHVAAYEDHHDRPLLTALVVRSDTEEPGEGFWTCARELGRAVEGDGSRFWRKQVDVVVEFWQDMDEEGEGERPGDIADEQIVTFIDGMKIKLTQAVDGTVRVVLDDAPWTIEAAHLRRNSKGRSVITMAPTFSRRPPQPDPQAVAR